MKSNISYIWYHVRVLLALVLAISICLSCNERFEDLNNRIDDIELRVQKLEQLCKVMNENMSSLCTIVSVLEQNNYIKTIEPILDGETEIGYRIIFTKGNMISIYHGKDGNTPHIAVKMDVDGIYYWTIDNEYVIDQDGNKIPVTGNDGLTPQLKIEECFWYISYDGGLSWSQLSKAVGEDGDSFFSSVTYDESFAYFVLNNGETLKVPVYADVPSPVITAARFLSKDNPKVLIYNLEAEMIGDALIEARIPHITDNKMLKIDLDYVGEKVLVDGKELYTDDLVIDFSKPVKLSVYNSVDQVKDYTVKLYAFTGLPIVYINTDDNIPVTTKDYYFNGTMKIVEDIYTKAPGDVSKYSVKIKGRGNSTWNKPKKPYKLKFSSKQSLLGEPADKEWVLLANYIDKTAIRNEIAFFMGRNLSNLAYTCRTHYVELILNNEYLGTYQLGEQQKISSSRVNVGDDGYLLEIDSKADVEDITFRINSIDQPINIKEPEVTVGDEKYQHIIDFMTQVENALFAEDWLDPEAGWQKYMDMDSFVDWYLINEISKNNDAIFFTSCYMHYAPGGKLCMGPLWDFDLAFGNANYDMTNADPKGWWIKNVRWYTRLFEDPVFVARVKERYNHFYSNLEVILNEINDCANYLQYSTVENNNKWNILYNYTVPNVSILGIYENEVQYLKSWLMNRMDWMKAQFDRM